MAHDTAKPSIFVNVAAWVLLLLVALAGVVALFSAGGVMPQVFKLAKFELRTTSTAVVVMVVAVMPLWMLLRFALSGRVKLYDDSANPRHAWIEENAQILAIFSLVVGFVGGCALLWILLAG